jgi:hypothetical protein
MLLAGGPLWRGREDPGAVRLRRSGDPMLALRRSALLLLDSAKALYPEILSLCRLPRTSSCPCGFRNVGGTIVC